MDAREFFYAVADMRQAQRNYFKTRDRSYFIAARAAEDRIDKEIARTKEILKKQGL